MMLVPLSVEVSSLEPTGYHTRRVDVKLSPAEAAFLARLRNHLQQSRPRGVREITIADAARHLIATAALAQAEVQQGELSIVPPAEAEAPQESGPIEFPSAFSEIKSVGEKK